MPIRPEEAGVEMDYTKAKQWMAEIDRELKTSLKADKYTIYPPRDLDSGLIRWVLKQYDALGWHTELHQDQRDGNWCDFVTPKGYEHQQRLVRSYWSDK